MSDGSYVVPAAEARAELRERGSRFAARVAPAAGEEAARRCLEEERGRFPDATHHCFAWRLGHPAVERASDAGEPTGTAGLPILRVLRGGDVSDVVAVVTRWFGGTKLGQGGLARAYAAAARAALAEAPLARRTSRRRFEIDVPHTAVGAVKRAVRPPAVELVEERYGERAVLVLAVATPEIERLATQLAPYGVVLDHG